MPDLNWHRLLLKMGALSYHNPPHLFGLKSSNQVALIVPQSPYYPILLSNKVKAPIRYKVDAYFKMFNSSKISQMKYTTPATTQLLISSQSITTTLAITISYFSADHTTQATLLQK